MNRADNVATFMCRLARNLGTLNLLESSGSVHFCIGTVQVIIFYYTGLL